MANNKPILTLTLTKKEILARLSHQAATDPEALVRALGIDPLEVPQAVEAVQALAANNFTDPLPDGFERAVSQ